MDALSFLMSFWSFVLFIMWLVKEGELPQKLSADYGSIVDFASELTAQERGTKGTYLPASLYSSIFLL